MPLMKKTQDAINEYKQFDGQKSIRSIAQKYDISKTTLAKHLRRSEDVFINNSCCAQNKSVDHLSIVEEYKKGSMPSKICASHGISMTTLYNILKKNNIQPIHRGSNIMEPNQQSRIASQYKNVNGSIKKISEQNGISWHGVKKILSDHDVRLKSRSESCKRIYVNENAFDKLNMFSEYWIGFIMADGCVDNKGRLKLSLKESDVAHLEKFKKFMQTNATLGIYRSRDEFYACSITICSHKICQILQEKYNIVPQKSLVLNPTNQQLIKSCHFWRGMIDGDGWVNYNNGNIKIGLCGSHHVIKAFGQYVANIGVHANIKRQGKIYRTDITGERAYIVIKNLYQKTPIALDRKRKVAKQVIKDKKGTYIIKQ